LGLQLFHRSSRTAPTVTILNFYIINNKTNENTMVVNHSSEDLEAALSGNSIF